MTEILRIALITVAPTLIVVGSWLLGMWAVGP